MRLVRPPEDGPEPAGAEAPIARDAVSASGEGFWGSAWRGAWFGLMHAACLSLALPPAGLWGFALLAAFPLVACALGGRAGPRAIGAALGTLPGWFWQNWWIAEVSEVGYPLLCVYLSAYPGLFVYVLARVSRARPRWTLAWVAPVLWVSIETLRAEYVLGGYAWFVLSQPLIDCVVLARPAVVFGAPVASFLAVMPAGVWGDFRRSRRGPVRTANTAMKIAGGAGLVLVVTIAGGPMRAARSVRVAVVCTNVPQNNKIAPTPEEQVREWADLERLTREAASGPPYPALIAWPETMKPGIALDAESVAAERSAGLVYAVAGAAPVPTASMADGVAALQREVGVPLVVGEEAFRGLRFEERGGRINPEYEARFNSVFLVMEGRVEPERYDKIELTPFGEELPGIRRWPWLRRQVLDLGARGMRLDLSRGTRATAFEIRPGGDGEAVRFATPICFEVTRTRLCRTMVYEGARRRCNLLVNLSNDGWFGAWDAGRKQHLQMARWRCLELGTSMVRAANTGLCAVIGPDGRVLASGVDGQPGAARAAGVLRADAPIAKVGTMYGRIGPVFSLIVMILGGSALVRALMIPEARPGGSSGTREGA